MKTYDRMVELKNACETLSLSIGELRDYEAMNWRTRELVAGAASAVKKAKESLHSASREFENSEHA